LSYQQKEDYLIRFHFLRCAEGEHFSQMLEQEYHLGCQRIFRRSIFTHIKMFSDALIRYVSVISFHRDSPNSINQSVIILSMKSSLNISNHADNGQMNSRCNQGQT
jgi:hypothetical protein